MEATERLVRTWMGSGRDQDVQETITGIVNGQITLLNVVKTLGEYLTAEEDELRTKGVEFLSLVIGSCPPEKINHQSTHVLITFYCGKLDDTETIVPALKGLATLAVLQTCTAPDVKQIVRSVFFNVKMTSLTAPVRFNVFSIIDSLVAQHRDVLKSMGNEFLSGYTLIAEGEKDPRNLLTAFAIARVILVEFNIHSHVEALFNITFCYFPISFRPPANDPYGISPDDLRTALRPCLCATPLFGPMAIPVYLEKLLAASPATKRDTLQSIAMSLPIYGPALARESARKLWNSLKLEIFQPTDPVTEGEALKTTQVLICTIYSDNATEVEDIKGLARDACEECIQILQEPEKSQAKPAIKVLCAFITTTSSVSKHTLAQTVPHLTKLFLDPNELPNRPPITALLAELVVAAKDSMLNSIPDQTAPLMPYKDQVLSVFTVGLKATSSYPPALSGLRYMVTTPGLLTDEELGFIVHNVNELLKEGSDDEGASEGILNLLSDISDINTRHVQDQILPPLFNSLPDRAPPRMASTQRLQYWRTLSALSKLCIQSELFETMVVRLLTKLDLICVPKGTIMVADSEPELAAAYAHSILMAFVIALETKVKLKHPDIPKYIDRLVSPLFNIFVYSSIGPQNMVATNSRVINAAGKIITLVVRTLPVQRQESYMIALFAAYTSGIVNGIAEGIQVIPADATFKPFESTVPSAQKDLVALFSSSIISLRPEVLIRSKTLSQILKMILGWNAPNGHAIRHQATWHLLATIVNKCVQDISPFLSFALDTYWFENIADLNLAPNERRHAIKNWVWISKGLVIQSHTTSKQFTDRIFEIMGDSQVGWDAGRAIGDIVATDAILTKQNHANIKILYAQKYFSGVLPRILVGAQSCVPYERSSHLVALASLIKAMPRIAYVQEIPSLISLLLQGLDLPDHEIRADIIDTFISVTDGESAQDKIISEHASTLVFSMLKNCLAAEMPTTRVRIAALRYLGLLPTIVRYDVLHPCRPSVIRTLAKALDDTKRSVRKEAVDARTNWFKYNG